jgi:hypothetical protein
VCMASIAAVDDVTPSLSRTVRRVGCRCRFRVDRMKSGAHSIFEVWRSFCCVCLFVHNSHAIACGVRAPQSMTALQRSVHFARYVVTNTSLDDVIGIVLRKPRTGAYCTSAVCFNCALVVSASYPSPAYRLPCRRMSDDGCAGRCGDAVCSCAVCSRVGARW